VPKQIIEYRCLLISPSDVAEERDALTRLSNLWNAQIGIGLGARLEFVRWESHSVPDLSGAPQEVLNKQIVDSCDLGIAIFWSKLGTPTAEHPSGSVEEIYRLLQRGARIITYFSSRPIPQDALQDDQFIKLQEIKEKFKSEGIYAQYSDTANLCEQVNLHLTNVITQLLAKDTGATTFVPASGTLTAPIPDVRVTVRAGFLKPPTSDPIEMLSVCVQNHSPIPVYLGNIFIEMNNGYQLALMRDFATGAWYSRTELQPGQSHSINVDPSELEKFSANLVCAGVQDEIGRIYRSTENELKSAIAALIQVSKE
jgi:hypothetical protein